MRLFIAENRKSCSTNRERGIVMNPTDVAAAWRTEKGYTGKGGVIVIYDGVVNSWVTELRDPDHWAPGCIAIDESGNQWIAKGGNRQHGADRWEPFPPPSTTAKERSVA